MPAAAARRATRSASDPARAARPCSTALMLAGGADLDPATYGAEPHPETAGYTGRARPVRDRAMPRRPRARHAGARHLPRHAAAQRRLRGHAGPAPPRRDRPHQHLHTPGAFADHEVRLEPGSLAARAAGAERSRSAPTTTRARPARRGARRDRLVDAGRRGRGDRAAGPRASRSAILWHPEEDCRDGALFARRWPQAATRQGVRGMSLAVIEPATERGDGRGPARRRGGGRRRGGRGEGGLPGVARRRARATGRRCSMRLADALERASPRTSRRSRRATPASRSPTPAGEIGMVAESFRYYAGAPERLLGRTIPVAGGVDMTFREPLGVVGLIVPWNFPLVIASWKVGAGAGRRQHDRAEARRADAADRARARADRARGRPARGRPQRRRRAGLASAASAWSSTPTSRRSPSPARPRSGAGIAAGAAGTIKRVTLELGGKSANVVFADADLEAAAAARARRRLRQRRAGLLRPLADPGRARRRWTSSWRRWRRRSARCGSATRSPTRPRWAR